MLLGGRLACLGTAMRNEEVRLYNVHASRLLGIEGMMIAGCQAVVVGE